MNKAHRITEARQAADQKMAKGIDWSKPLRVLSEKTGLSISTLSRLRRRLGKPAAQTHADPLTYYAGVDWSMSDAEIGRLKNRTRARIGQVRRQLGMAPSDNSYKAWFEANQHLNGLVDAVGLASMLNTSTKSARQLAQKYHLNLKE